MVEIKAELTATYTSNRIAEAVFAAIKIDNIKGINTQVKDKSIHTEINTRSLRSLKATLDDILRNQNIAEEMVK